MHAFISETLTPEADWPNSVPAIRSIINNSPSRRLGGRAPITVQIGMPSGNPLTVALTDCNIQDVDTTDQAMILQMLNINKLLESLDKMHKAVYMTLSAYAVERHNAKTHVVPYKHTVGYYVVVARTHGPALRFRQLGRISPDFSHPVGLHRRD